MAVDVLASMSRPRLVVHLCSKLLVVGGFWEVQHTNICESFLRRIRPQHNSNKELNSGQQAWAYHGLLTSLSFRTSSESMVNVGMRCTSGLAGGGLCNEHSMAVIASLALIRGAG